MINNGGGVISSSVIFHKKARDGRRRVVDAGNHVKYAGNNNTISESKRLIGKQFNDSEITHERENHYFPFDIQSGPHGEVMIKVCYDRGEGEEVLHPYEVSS